MFAEGGPVSQPSAVPPATLPCQPAGFKARCLPFSRDPAGGSWEQLEPGVQQRLEEKEQALAALQETVQVPFLGLPQCPLTPGSGGTGCRCQGRLRPSVGWGRQVLDQGELHLVWLFKKQFNYRIFQTPRNGTHHPASPVTKPQGPCPEATVTGVTTQMCWTAGPGSWEPSQGAETPPRCLPLDPFTKGLQWSRVQEVLRPLTAIANDHPVPPTPCGRTGCSFRPQMGVAGCTVGLRVKGVGGNRDDSGSWVGALVLVSCFLEEVAN